MNHDGPFRLISALVLAGALGASVRIRHRADRQGGRLPESSGQILIVALRLVALVILMPLLIFIVNPNWVRWAQVPVPGWARWLASGVALLTVPLIQWTFSSLGTNVSPSHQVREGATLVTSGPYHYIRHPIYSFGALAFGSLIVVTRLWTMLIAIVPLVAIILRTSKEEEKLIERFGDEYRAYIERTGRFLPKLLG